MLPNTTSTDAADAGPRFWFAAKRYGWGWGAPIAWQGWVVLALWLLVVAIGSSFLAGRSWLGFAAFMLLMSALLFGVCYVKGEPPRWRWGK